MLKSKITKFIMFFMLSFLVSGQASAEPLSERIAGQNRYDTAVNVSQKYWTKADYAIVASGIDFPDALCAAPLSKKYDAPILLNEGNSLNLVTKEELKRLGVKNVIIIGGTGVVSSKVEEEIQSMQYSENNSTKNVQITRIAGQNRYETSIKVAKILDKSTKIFVAYGENFPDAISVGSIAATEGMPIILTAKDSIPNNTKEYIQEKKPEQAYIIGGTSVISDAVEKQIPNARRISGADRYETNAIILNTFENCFNYDKAYVASGENFADALTGSAAASKSFSPLILVGRNVSSFSRKYVVDRLSGTKNITIFGGTGAVSSISARKLISGYGFKVVLDPGHGGYDSGAVGSAGIKEKDVNLAVTLKLGSILKNNGVDVVYTRTGDDVSWSNDINDDLQTRCDISNNTEPDYFICIHSNSSSSAAANGTETYYYSGNEEGQRLAGLIQDELVKALGTYDRGIKTANFYVLRNTNAPAVLVELAFISNSNEERLLNDEKFQNSCAQAIASAVLKAYGK